MEKWSPWGENVSPHGEKGLHKDRKGPMWRKKPHTFCRGDKDHLQGYKNLQRGAPILMSPSPTSAHIIALMKNIPIPIDNVGPIRKALLRHSFVIRSWMDQYRGGWTNLAVVRRVQGEAAPLSSPAYATAHSDSTHMPLHLRMVNCNSLVRFLVSRFHIIGLWHCDRSTNVDS